MEIVFSHTEPYDTFAPIRAQMSDGRIFLCSTEEQSLGKLGKYDITDADGALYFSTFRVKQKIIVHTGGKDIGTIVPTLLGWNYRLEFKGKQFSVERRLSFPTSRFESKLFDFRFRTDTTAKALISNDQIEVPFAFCVHRFFYSWFSG